MSNTFTKIWNALTLNNEPQAEYKKIAELNNHVHYIKEMDSAKSVSQIDESITSLKQWELTRQKENDSLSLKQLKSKRAILTNASSRFNSRFYLMMLAVVANAATMSSVCYSVIMSDHLSVGQKSLAIGTAGVGMVEGTIHLYKAKRFFAQKREIANVEIHSVDKAIANKSHSHKL